MENAFHEWLIENLPDSERSLVSLGDDAAVLDWSGDDDCVITSDMLADGVHFLSNEVSPERIGRKSLAVNLSDLAAMGAQPVAAVVSIMLPADATAALPRSLLSGMLPLADEFGMTIVGGDTNSWKGDLVISVTAFGKLDGQLAFRRDGANAGDRLFVTGPLGGSLLAHHLDFTPRVALALELQSKTKVSAAMDISDGLAMDASRLAKRSGCGIELTAETIPVALAAKQMSANGSGKTPLEHALGDGEDFELLIAISPNTLLDKSLADDLGLVEVGRCTEDPDLWLVNASGERKVLKPVGYQHGKRSK